MKKISIALSLTLVSALLYATPTYAAGATLTMSLNQTPGRGEPVVTLYGHLKPAKASVPVTIQIYLKGKWQDTRFKSKTAKVGTWRVVAVATALDAKMKYRAKAIISGKTLFSSAKEIVIKPIPVISDGASLLIDPLGPGGRIHGSDVSRWQHPNDQPIDFKKMFDAGMRFVIIKGSDAQEKADIETMRWLVGDRNAAQAAGLYTGMYHFAYMPNTTDRDYVIRDAKAQAQKVIWRLASLGGYNEMDLPVALDLENNCVKKNRSGNCVKYLGRTLVTAWAETWLQTVEEKTGRKPFIYSYPQFLESSMVRSETLRQYPLWLAQYGINPADPIAQPGLKTVGCYVHSWSTANCSSQWQIWQYSSCGIGKKYGVASTRVDLNVFRGDAASFLQLTRGVWTPATGDFLPVKEPTTMLITDLRASSTDKPVRIKVEVKRPTGNPVVTGTVAFRLNGERPPKVNQTPSRDASGVWSLTLRNLPAGLTEGFVAYVDQTGTHAEIRQNISFNLEQGPEPSPSPTPTPKPTKPAVAVDTCKGQIKN